MERASGKRSDSFQEGAALEWPAESHVRTRSEGVLCRAPRNTTNNADRIADQPATASSGKEDASHAEGIHQNLDRFVGEIHTHCTELTVESLGELSPSLEELLCVARIEYSVFVDRQPIKHDARGRGLHAVAARGCNVVRVMSRRHENETTRRSSRHRRYGVEVEESSRSADRCRELIELEVSHAMRHRKELHGAQGYPANPE